jgi:hypothetical protein
MNWYYLSCANKEFMAAILVQGTSTLDAVMNAAALKQAPPEGAQVLGYRISPEQLPPKKYLNRLLSREEVEKLWPGSMTLREAKATGKYDVDAVAAAGETLCPSCVSGLCKVH